MSGEKYIVCYRNFVTGDGEKGHLLFATVKSANEFFPEKTISGDKCEPVGGPELAEVDEISWEMLQKKIDSGIDYIEGYTSDYLTPPKKDDRPVESSALKCDPIKPYRVWFLNYKDTNEGTEGSLLFRKRRDALRVLKDKDFQSTSKIDFIGKSGMTQIHCINRQLLSRHRFIESCDNSPLTPMQIRGAD